MGASLSAEQKAAVVTPIQGLASPNSDSDDDDDYLDTLRANRAKILFAVAGSGKQDIPKATLSPSQLTPSHTPAIPESKLEEDQDEDYHTPVGSPTGTGRLSPPLIPLQSTPTERLIPEGQSNVFPPSMPRPQSKQVVKY